MILIKGAGVSEGDSMSGIETAAAGAALSQAKGFVDALAGPFIDRVRRWSLDRELRRQLAPDEIAKVIRRYIDRTLTLAAGIQSVVFPQTALPLADTYEPLLLESVPIDNRRSQTLSAGELLGERGHATIVDQAGMGKSTFSKFLTTRVCAITDKVPILFNLRNYQAGEPLVKALLKEFHEFDRQFGEDLFCALLVNGKFFIILDGFDEVASQFQSDVRREIEFFAVKCGGSRIALTSRPQANIPILAGGTRYHFRRLTTSQAHSLLTRYDKFANLKVGERLIKQLRSVPEELLETPLLVALLYRTFGINNTIADRATTFYSDTYEALFKGHDLTKAGFSRQKECRLDIDEFRRLLQLIAFHAVVQGKLSWSSEQDLVDFLADTFRRRNLQVALARNIADDLTMAVSLVLKDGHEYRFIHKTFLEYFAAEFVTRSPDSKTLLRKLYLSRNWQSLSVVAKFINELSPALTRDIITAPAASEVLNLQVDGTWSAEQTIVEGFEWSLRWGGDNELGGFFKNNEQEASGDLVAKGSIPVVVSERAMTISLKATPIAGLRRLPPFAWDALTGEATLQEVKGYAESKVALAKVVTDFARAKTHRLSKDQVQKLLDNAVFNRFAKYLVAQICSGGKSERIVGKAFEETRCRDVLHAQEGDAKHMEAIDALLNLPVARLSREEREH